MPMQFHDNISTFLDAIGVPTRTFVDTPESRLLRNIDEVFANITKRHGLADQEVRAHFGAAYSVDEMALYFAEEHALFSFMAKAVQRGWLVFNQSEDVVETSPIRSNYAVVYWFLRHPELPYRLELMMVSDGFSPYHGGVERMCEDHGLATVLVHASFKVNDEQEYAAVGVALRNGGYELMQHCSSTYGRFSYYVDNESAEIPAIKPRQNLREGTNSGN